MKQTKTYKSLDRIQNKNLKQGYKKTKLGRIPGDWKLLSLDEIGVFSKGKGISKGEIKSEGFPCIRYAEIYTLYNEYTSCFKSKINEESTKNSKAIETGDLLFAGSGETLKDIGKCIAYIGGEKVYAGGDIIILRQKTQDSKYLGFLLNHDAVNKQIFKIGQGHSVVHIYSSGLKKVKIPIPPFPEQKKIATILSTWDTAITAQKKIITQKQYLKKGLMQVLLTGKKRFDGFTEEWKEVNLEECLMYKPKYGINAPAVNFSEALPKYLRITDIKDDGRYTTSNFVSVNHPDSENFILQKGDIVFARTGNTTGKTYLYNENDGELVYAGFLIKITPNPKSLLPEFLKFYSGTQKYWHWVKVMSIRSGQPGINASEYSTMPIAIPNIGEQKKIASVLLAADKEIEKLQQQLKQLNKQKQGLMQKLLTGESRVKI